MSKQNDIIELNGYKYDAKTGAMLCRADGKSAMKHIDGFARRTKSTPSKTVTPKKPTPSHAVHQKTSKSKTLMRHAVKKPSVAHKQEQQPSHELQKRVTTPDPQRLARANQAQKSPHISKFGVFKPTTEPLEVKQAPEPINSKSAETEQKRALLPLSPFDMALQNARSHEQQHINSTSFRRRLAKNLRLSPRAATITAGLVVVVVAGIFFANQHMPTLAVRLAATRAGVEARLPGYRPAGFSLAGPIEYSSGEITLEYQSNSDDRRFRVVQKKSDWNSQSLLENFITASEKNYQTFQDKGKTIYIYDGNNATWVSGGVWYQVEGEASLNSDQLLRIASGL